MIDIKDRINWEETLRADWQRDTWIIMGLCTAMLLLGIGLGSVWGFRQAESAFLRPEQSGFPLFQHPPERK